MKRRYLRLRKDLHIRKDALFAGHDQAAENWACIASLIEPCKLCGVEPQAYLTDVLTKLVNLWPASRLDELIPWAWATEHATRPIQRLLRRLNDLGWGELRLEVG